jgi:hypothetical protein
MSQHTTWAGPGSSAGVGVDWHMSLPSEGESGGEDNFPDDPAGGQRAEPGLRRAKASR